MPPHKLEAEEATLGACLLDAKVVDDVIPLLTPGDFYKPRHQHVYDAIKALHYTNQGVDVVTVGAELDRVGLLEESGGTEFLLSLINATPSISRGVHYATIVLKAAQQRAMIRAATDLAAVGYEETGDVAAAIEAAKSNLDLIELRGGMIVESTPGTEFMGTNPARHSWVVPHILEDDDRLLLTGSEGSGKTLSLLQFAVMTACGRHWWTQTPMQARRTLFVDMEIGNKRTRRRAELFRRVADRAMPGWEANLTIRSRAEDIDVSTRAGSSWLSALLDSSGAELLVIGPIYRLTSGIAKAGDIGGEDAAKRAAFALDKIRERYGCALVSETHAAKGEASRSRDMRPFGSSVWTRWPEFGYALVRQSSDAASYHPDNREWVGWRGDRDPREWPTHFRQSSDLNEWRLNAEFDNGVPSWYGDMMRGKPF